MTVGVTVYISNYSTHHHWRLKGYNEIIKIKFPLLPNA